MDKFPVQGYKFSPPTPSMGPFLAPFVLSARIYARTLFVNSLTYKFVEEIMMNNVGKIYYL